jgi:glycosyltransferase involved in cell wall biosynthesis
MMPGEDQSPGKRQSLHVLALTPFYPSEIDDSQGCFVSEPLQALSQVGIVNTVLALQPIYRKKRRISRSSVSAEWVRYFSLPGSFGLPTAGAFAFARLVGRVRDLQREQRIDLIHAHAPLPAGHLAMLLNSELGLPYVVSVHGQDVFSTGHVAGRVGQWCDRISRRVYQASKRVICISEIVREKLLQGMGASCRTSVVYNGVDPEVFAPGKASSTQSLNVLSVGNLLPTKGHEVLMRALAIIAPEFPGLMLDVIGDGPQMTRLQQLIRELEISDRVRFLGRQSRQEVAKAMRNCTVFALPSSNEGLGCVYLEAMSSAKPAIGCRGQGIAEIIRQGSNGFLVGPGNDKELALVLGMLLRDERKRHNVGIRARDTILDRFTLKQQAENLARIYRECEA